MFFYLSFIIFLFNNGSPISVIVKKLFSKAKGPFTQVTSMNLNKYIYKRNLNYKLLLITIMTIYYNDYLQEYFDFKIYTYDMVMETTAL